MHNSHITVSLPEAPVKKQFEINSPAGNLKFKNIHRKYANDRKFHSVQQKCVRLDAPVNGRVAVETNVATYSCDIGYEIDGPTQRTCCGGQWTEKAPVCIAQEHKGPTEQPVIT